MGKFIDAMRSKFEDNDAPKLADFVEGTFAWLIQKRIDESALPGSRKLLRGTIYSYRALQRSTIGKKDAVKAKRQDFIDHIRSRRADGVTAATALHDISHLRVILRDGIEQWEIEDLSYVEWQKAKKKLETDGLIAKSMKRDRRPTDDEIASLRALFEKQNAGKRSEIDMVDVLDFQLASGRRIGETCRIRRKDVDVERRLCWIYDLKNPKGRGFHAQFPLLGRAWEIVEKRLAAMMDQAPNARVFPYKSTSITQRYIDAKKALGIENLRLHDSRREALSRLFEAGYSVPEVQKVSLHLNAAVLLANYTALKAEDLHRGPASKRVT